LITEGILTRSFFSLELQSQFGRASAEVGDSLPMDAFQIQDLILRDEHVSHFQIVAQVGIQIEGEVTIGTHL